LFFGVLELSPQTLVDDIQAEGREPLHALILSPMQPFSRETPL